MNFNTVEFVIIFLPIVLVLFYSIPVRGRLVFLSVASLIFYAVSGLIPTAFMVGSMIWGYLTAHLVRQRSGRWSMVLAISLPLLILYCFKYMNFTLNTFNTSREVRDHFYVFLSVVLPAGISFYTFTIVSYLIDVADKNTEPERNLTTFVTYVTFFPHLIAGPILRYEQIRGQLERIGTVRSLQPDLVKGFKYLSVGLFGKVFAADMLGVFMRPFYTARSDSSLDALYSVLAYSFQIYYDFWAYSLMAIGLGKMFSVDLPMNFREPYISKNPMEFWRRWHMTLSFWMRDYLYLKLGGNRAYLRNIIIVFFVVGLWHGAGWNFVAWGIYHALLIVIYRISRRMWDALPDACQVALTFSLVSLGWPLFHYSLEEFADVFRLLFSFQESGAKIFHMKHWLYLGVIGAWSLLAREEWWLYNSEGRPIFDSAVVHAVLCFMALLYFSYSSTFIYFRF